VRFDVITLFPEMFGAVTSGGVTARAFQRKLAMLHLWNPRDYTQDVHRTVDDRPYGGGPGMVMKYEPLTDAMAAVRTAGASGPLIYLSPQGRRLTQQAVHAMAKQPSIVLLCGRYEGVDERFVKRWVDEEWSIGDYVLSGGELPAMVLIDAVVRTLPGVLGDELSSQQDSFVEGLLDCPHYTRPEHLDVGDVPEVLLGGNHAAIRRWRSKQALGRTWLRRPELLSDLALTKEQQELLAEFQTEQRRQNKVEAVVGRTVSLDELAKREKE